MYWQLQDTNLHVIGSIHSADHQLKLTPTLTKILEDAEVITFESNFSLRPDSQFGLYPNSNGLSKNIPPDLYADAQRMWGASNRPADELERHLPWHAAFILMSTILQSHGCRPSNGIDAQVLEQARRTGKALFFLETVASSMEPFRQAPHEEHLTFLSTILRKVEEGVRDVKAMSASWEANNPDGLLPLYEKSMRLMPRSYAGALGGRNRLWFSKLLRLARGRKRVVAVVGALHMIGPEGLPMLFKASGIDCQHVTFDTDNFHR